MNDIHTLRELVATCLASEGCDCCEPPEHEEHRRALAEFVGLVRDPESPDYNWVVPPKTVPLDKPKTVP